MLTRGSVNLTFSVVRHSGQSAEMAYPLDDDGAGARRRVWVLPWHSFSQAPLASFRANAAVPINVDLAVRSQHKRIRVLRELEDQLSCSLIPSHRT